MSRSPTWKIMVNKYCIIWLFYVMILQSCDHNFASEHKLSPEQLHNAAIYNTQLGLAYLKYGDRVRAKRKLLAALRFNLPETQTAMGYFMETTGDLKTADFFYKKAIILSNHSAASLNNYGTFLCRTGHYKQANRYFMQSLSDIYYVHNASVYENAGLCAVAAKQYKQAQYYFDKALRSDPNYQQSLIEIIKIDLKLQNWQHAVYMLNKYRNKINKNLVLQQLERDVNKKH